jgi:hypothetical protein
VKTTGDKIELNICGSNFLSKSKTPRFKAGAIARLLWWIWRRRLMEDHAVRAVLGWGLRLRFAQRRFQNLVGQIGHRAALAFGFMI